MELAYAFTIFFISIGPLKVIPAFFMHTIKNSEDEIKKIAVKSVFYSIVIILFVALVSHQLLNTWHVSLPAFVLSGGVMLFISSLNSINKFKGIPLENSGEKNKMESNEKVTYSMKQINALSLSPIAIPVIISPIGVVAVISVISLSHIYHDILEVVGLLFAIMVMNFISMLFSRYIMTKIGIPVFSILGWLFAILQAGLAVQFIVNSIHKLFGTGL